MNGAATNPDCHALAYAGAQVKKGLDVAKKLGAENFGTMFNKILKCSFSAAVSPTRLTVCLSPQCFGAGEKVSFPSTTLTLALN